MRKELWLVALPLWTVAATAAAQSETVVVTSCPNSGGVGAAGFGATLMVGSVVGLVISSVRLKRAKEGKPHRQTHRALP